MPTFQLWRASDQETFDADARDENHAAAVFGEMLGIRLTMQAGREQAGYSMHRIETSRDTPLAIPLWEMRVRSN